jgi:hypothetical protein
MMHMMERISCKALSISIRVKRSGKAGGLIASFVDELG